MNELNKLEFEQETLGVFKISRTKEVLSWLRSACSLGEVRVEIGRWVFSPCTFVPPASLEEMREIVAFMETLKDPKDIQITK